MFQLLTNPKEFFRSNAEHRADLFLPAVIVVLESAIGFAIYFLLSNQLFSGLPEETRGFLVRLITLFGLIGVVGSVLLWPLVAAIIAGTGIVFWNRSGNFKKLVEAVGFCFAPFLVSAFLTFFLLLLFPVQAAPSDVDLNNKTAIQNYLFNETVLGVTWYVSAGMFVWSGILLICAVQAYMQVNWSRAAATVSIPICAYFLIVLLIRLMS